MQLKTAIMVGDFLQGAVQPVLFTAATYYYYDKNKVWMTGTGAVTSLLLNSIITLFFTSKAYDWSWRSIIEGKNTGTFSHRVIVPLASTIVTVVLDSRGKAKLQVEGKHIYEFAALVGLKIIYDLISFVVYSVAHAILKLGVKNTLENGLSLIKDQQKNGIEACGEILQAIHKMLEPFKEIDFVAHPIFKECIANTLENGLSLIKDQRKKGVKGCNKIFQKIYKAVEIFRAINFAAHPIFRECIESTLAEGLDLTESQENKVADAWDKITRTIKEKTHSLRTVFYFGNQGLAPRTKTFYDLDNADKITIINNLAKQKIKLFNAKVFSIEECPGLIFKKVNRDDFDKLIEHKYVCENLQLTELVIPNSRFMQIKGEVFMVQEKLDYKSSKQPYYYLKYASRLEKAVEQLKTYVFKTGEADVEWRNMPIVGNLKGKDTLQIALIDHEYMPQDIPAWGIVGSESLKRTGLIGLLCEEQACKIAAWAQQQIVNNEKITLTFERKRRIPRKEEIDEALEKRIAKLRAWEPELVENKKFKTWSATKNRKSNQAISHISTLGLTESETKVAMELLQSFNYFLIGKDPKDYSSRRELRTIEMMFDRLYFFDVGQILSKLKSDDEIFDYKIINNGCVITA